MTGFRGLLLPAALVLLPPAPVVAAQELPAWRPAEICARDSAAGQCRLFEAEARRTVSASWRFVPDAIRKACLDRLKGPADHSFRALSECLEDEYIRAHAKTAIATSATPDVVRDLPVPAPLPGMAPPPVPQSLSPELAPKN